jgi:hypothetical protein
MNSWDFDVDSSVSNYNADWKGGKKIETYNSSFFLDNMPIIFSRSGYLNSSFFVNFTDPRKILFPEKFFQYKHSLTDFLKYVNLSKIFKSCLRSYYNNKTFNSFYSSLLNVFFSLRRNAAFLKFSKFYKYSKRAFAILHKFKRPSLGSKSNLGAYLKNIGSLRPLKMALNGAVDYKAYKKKGAFLFKPGNSVSNNLIFKFYYYSTWVAKKFFRVTHWFNLNAQSLKHKNFKNDFRWMAGYRVDDLGDFAKWSLAFLNKKEKLSLEKAYNHLKNLKLQKKKAALMRGLRRKVFLKNRLFLKAKDKSIKVLESLPKPLLKKIEEPKSCKKLLSLVKVQKNLKLYQAKLGRKASKMHEAAKSILRAEEKIRSLFPLASGKSKEAASGVVSLIREIFKIKKSIIFKWSLIAPKMATSELKIANIGLKISDINLKKSRSFIEKGKKIKKLASFIEHSIGPHRRWSNEGNLKSLMFFGKWARFQNKRVKYHKKHIIRNFMAISKLTGLTFLKEKTRAKRVEIYNMVLSYLKAKKKTKLCAKAQALFKGSLSQALLSDPTKEKKATLQILAKLRRRNELHSRRAHKSNKWNKKNYEKFFAYMGYFICNIALYSQLLKKAKMQRSYGTKLVRNFKSGLYSWRQKSKHVESCFRNILRHKKGLSIEKQKARFLNLYNAKPGGLALGGGLCLEEAGPANISALAASFSEAKKKSVANYLRSMNSFKASKKKAKLLMLKLLAEKKIKTKVNKYKMPLQKRKRKHHYKSLIRRKRFQYANLMVKIKFKLLKIRKIFLLFVLQNLKNKFWASFSLLSKDANCNYTYDMLVFLKKYMLLKKYILKSDKSVYSSINSPLKAGADR